MTSTGPSHVVGDQEAVFAFLSDPTTHGFPVSRIDTHGAVVVLAGRNAYKVKRAVRFSFMDFSTLDRRKAACEAEVRVNSVYAPSLYLGVVAIVRLSDGTLAIGSSGEPVEWAVHMRRFDECATFDKLARSGKLTSQLVADLARTVVLSHASAPIKPGEPAVRALETYIADNATAFAESPHLFPPDRASNLTSAAWEALEKVRPTLLARGAAGRVRRCHGDLHLRNVVLLEGTPTLFDAIEFDEDIATGDVLYDLAFLVMDLVENGHPREANLLLNRYLWTSPADDIEGLSALPLFVSLRAAIRAKVVAASLETSREEDLQSAAEEARRYFGLAEQALHKESQVLVAIGGLSGSGKSTLASTLAPGIMPIFGAVHLRSDIERKRYFDVAETERLPAQAYTEAVAETVYRLLRRKARAALAAGLSVIVDAVHARPAERDAIREVAEEEGVAFVGLWMNAPSNVLRTRVETRTHDASDADAATVDAQSMYDIGVIDWTCLDASGPADTTAELARGIAGAALAKSVRDRPTDQPQARLAT